MTMTDFDTIQFRAATVEDLDTVKREIWMRAVPYEHETALTSSLAEIFTVGTFGRSAKDPGRIRLFHDHGGPVVGKATEVFDKSDGVWVRSRVSKVPSGDELLTLAEDGVVEPSIEFQPDKNTMVVTNQRAGGVLVRHKRGILKGVALVGTGAYADAAFIASVRDADVLNKKREEVIARLRGLSA